MSIRRALAGGLVLALLAPLLLSALPGAGTPVAERTGGSCCVAMPCCETGAACAAGGCESRKAPVPSNSDAPRLAVGCSGSTPAAVPAVDRDPMIAAAALGAPAPPALADAQPPLSAAAADRAGDPRDPPPRV